MKEIHAYRNNDGTYKLSMIAEAIIDGQLTAVNITVARAQVDLTYLTEPSTSTMMSITLKENHYEN